MKKETSIELVAKHILLVRGLKVMLANDLAELYGVKTKELNRGVRRNKGRFPGDFMFQLTRREEENLKYQIGTSSWGGARRAAPYAFTEQGAAMLSSVLRSKKAIRVNIEIMRAFARLREVLAVNKDFARRLEELERKYNAHDHQFQAVFDSIRQLMKEPEKTKKRIGFLAEEKRAVYQFRPATSKEEKEMLKDLEEYKSGKVKGIRVDRNFRLIKG